MCGEDIGAAGANVIKDSRDSERMKNLYKILRELAQQNNSVVKEIDTEQNETNSPQTSKAEAGTYMVFTTQQPSGADAQPFTRHLKHASAIIPSGQ